MLALKSNCESCHTELTAESTAYICSFECTFCRGCAANHFQYVCPNCQGNLEKRPIHPRERLNEDPNSTQKMAK